MNHRFKIEKVSGRYIIKHKVGLFPPFYYWEIMTKNQFFGDLTPYGDAMLCRELADFSSIENTYDALHQYAQLNGLNQIIVKKIEE